MTSAGRKAQVLARRGMDIWEGVNADGEMTRYRRK